MSDHLTALFCIGCGRLDAPPRCEGTCDERELDLVFAGPHDNALQEVADAFRRAGLLREVVLQLAAAPPHGGSQEAHRALRVQARAALREATAGDDHASDDAEEVQRITALHCPACGAIEAPRDCIGVCIRRPVEMVPATRYDEVSALRTRAARQVGALSQVVRQLAWATPRTGEWERTGQALRTRARAALASC